MSEEKYKDRLEGSDYESCEEELQTSGRDNDLTRPSEWTPGDKDSENSFLKEEDSGGGNTGNPTEERESEKETVDTDSTGEERGGAEYVDEERLAQQQDQLTDQQLEERKEEAGKLKQEGNSLYKEGKAEDAVSKYTEALRICPLKYNKDRAVLYANRGQMNKVLGHKDKGIRNCTKAIELHPEYLKAILRRAELYEETEKLDEALEDYKRVLELDPNNTESKRAVNILPQKIEERNEKLKAEMMDNLKKLGNMVLKPFGLSTQNFNMVQDPNSGGYNIQFTQNK